MIFLDSFNQTFHFLKIHYCKPDSYYMESLVCVLQIFSSIALSMLDDMILFRMLNVEFFLENRFMRAIILGCSCFARAIRVHSNLWRIG